jgi:hypothetical protein
VTPQFSVKIDETYYQCDNVFKKEIDLALGSLIDVIEHVNKVVDIFLYPQRQLRTRTIDLNDHNINE